VNTHFLALAVSSILVLGLLFTLAFTSLTVGALEWLFGRPRLTFLRSTLGENGLAFRFSWNSAKEEAKINLIRIRLFNPFGVPSQLEVSKEFEAHDSTFVMDLDLGMGLRKILESCNTQNATL